MLGFGVMSAQAHQLRPAIISINFKSTTEVTIQIETNAEAILAGIGSAHENTDNAPQVAVYRELRELSSQMLAKKFKLVADQYSKSLNLLLDGKTVAWQFISITVPKIGDTRSSRKSVIQYRSQYADNTTSAVWSYAKKHGDAVVNFTSKGQKEKTSYWLVKGKPSPQYEIGVRAGSRTWYEVAWNYTKLGFIHIMPKGLDHILFVLGLFLLSRHLKPLLWQVTAFTLAHSITLALSIYGLINIPASIVEPLIALSIAYIGIENILTKELKPWRMLIVFLFGLLHGMGFAGVLAELGLPESEFITALISFNIGVELGQLSVILLAFITVFWLIKQKDLYRKIIIIPASLMIAMMGIFWTWQRLS